MTICTFILLGLVVAEVVTSVQVGKQGKRISELETQGEKPEKK